MTDQSPPERPPATLPRLGEIGLANYAPYLMNRIMGRYNASLRDEMAGLGVNRRAKLTPYRRPKLTPLVVSRSGPEPTELITEWRRVRP